MGVQVTADPAALDLLAQHLPPFFGGPGEVVAEARLEGTEHLHVELPDGLSVSGPYGTETFRAAASPIVLPIAAQLPDRVAVHAGVVAWQGRAIMMPARTLDCLTAAAANGIRGSRGEATAAVATLLALL